MLMPTVSRYDGRLWHGGFDECANRRLFFRLLERGAIRVYWRWPKFVFGIGCDLCDGPIYGPVYFFHCGIFSVLLSAE
jgi:hypothetical protein